MLSRRPMTDRSYRTRGTHSGRTLPDHMNGTRRTTPIRRPDPNYPTIPVKEDTK